jgi:hypothetical protein
MTALSNKLGQVQVSRYKIPILGVLSLALLAGSLTHIVARASYFSAANQDRPNALSVAIHGFPGYSRKEMRVHRFLWNKWQHHQAATAQVTFFGIDAGNIYTIYIKKILLGVGALRNI